MISNWKRGALQMISSSILAPVVCFFKAIFKATISVLLFNLTGSTDAILWAHLVKSSGYHLELAKETKNVAFHNKEVHSIDAPPFSEAQTFSDELVWKSFADNDWLKCGANGHHQILPFLPAHALPGLHCCHLHLLRACGVLPPWVLSSVT